MLLNFWRAEVNTTGHFYRLVMLIACMLSCFYLNCFTAYIKHLNYEVILVLLLGWIGQIQVLNFCTTDIRTTGFFAVFLHVWCICCMYCL